MVWLDPRQLDGGACGTSCSSSSSKRSAAVRPERKPARSRDQCPNASSSFLEESGSGERVGDDEGPEAYPTTLKTSQSQRKNVLTLRCLLPPGNGESVPR